MSYFYPEHCDRREEEKKLTVSCDHARHRNPWHTEHRHHEREQDRERKPVPVIKKEQEYKFDIAAKDFVLGMLMLAPWALRAKLVFMPLLQLRLYAEALFSDDKNTKHRRETARALGREEATPRVTRNSDEDSDSEGDDADDKRVAEFFLVEAPFALQNKRGWLADLSALPARIFKKAVDRMGLRRGLRDDGAVVGASHAVHTSAPRTTLDAALAG